MSSASVAQAFGFKTTRALGTSPHFSSGTGITPASRTPGGEDGLSSSREEMFSPPLTMMFLLATTTRQVAIFRSLSPCLPCETNRLAIFGGSAWLPPVSFHHAVAPRLRFRRWSARRAHVSSFASTRATPRRNGNPVIACPTYRCSPCHPSSGFNRRNRKCRGSFCQAVPNSTPTEFFFNLTNEIWRRRGPTDHNPAKAA